MKKKLFFLIIVVIAISCSDDEGESEDTNVEYKQKMSQFVIDISQYAKSIKSNFIIIPQNGAELVTSDGEEDGQPNTQYLNAIDGNGQEDLFYGYNDDDEASPNNETDYLKSFLNISRNSGNTILVTDYCFTHSKMDNSYLVNKNAGYISFAADERELNNIPDYPAIINNENSADINQLSDIKNFLYLINPENYSSIEELITSIQETNYDLLIIDVGYDENTVFSPTQMNQLKIKKNGGKRLVICYLSIGEAEDYRYYWKDSWNTVKPSWLKAENSEWGGNYAVEYWNNEWQNIIFGNNDSYLYHIISYGFDGVYLDKIDSFEYFE